MRNRTIVSRLISDIICVGDVLQNCDNFEMSNWIHGLHVPLLEVLRYPQMLFCKALAALFVKALITLEFQACSLNVEERLAGVYLLLVHPEMQVRSMSMSMRIYE